MLWLLMSYSYVEDAARLALEYIDACLGEHSEQFDIKVRAFFIRNFFLRLTNCKIFDQQVALFPNSPPVYFPHNHMQNLLLLLSEDKKSNLEFRKVMQDNVIYESDVIYPFLPL